MPQPVPRPGIPKLRAGGIWHPPQRHRTARVQAARRRAARLRIGGTACKPPMISGTLFMRSAGRLNPLTGYCSTIGRALRPDARPLAQPSRGPSIQESLMTSQIQKSRKASFDLQAGKCHYCGLRMWLGSPCGPSPLRCTAEHLTPRSEGGADSRTNIVAACLHCNRTRHKRKKPPTPERYRAEVRRRVARGRWLPKSILLWGSRHQ